MVVLVGNPNCGKTSIFNIITKSSLQTGNYNGVTVNYKIGYYKNIKIVDLPGIYSLNPYTDEEKVTINFIKENKIDLIINVIDINSLNRSLYLTTRLNDLKIPMIILLNKCESNYYVDYKLLESILNTKVIMVSTLKNIGINSFKEYILKEKYDYSSFNLESSNNTDEDIINRYKNIDIIVSKVSKNKKENSNFNILFKYKYLLMILCLLLFILIYYFLINILGSIILDRLNSIINYFIYYLNIIMNRSNLSIFFKRLIFDGIISGIINIINFIPQLFFLMFIISILEDTGLIGRISILFNKLLNKINISSNSLYSLFLACDCSALAILHTRTIKSESERKKVIFLIPLIPCCAKLSIIVFIISTFYNNSFLIFLSFYIISILLIIILSKLFKKSNSNLILEIPNIKLPSIKNSIKNTFNKMKSFIKKISTVMIFISILNFLLVSLDKTFSYTNSIEDSLLYIISSRLSIMFKPFLGINNKEAFISILSGLFAKEQVVSTIGVVGNSFNYITAYTFCLFNIFTLPCINTISAMKKECGIKLTILYNLIYIIISYIISIILFRVLICLL